MALGRGGTARRWQLAMSEPTKDVEAPRTGGGALSISDSAFVRRVLIVLAIGTCAALVWLLTEVLLLVFAAVLVAVILRAVAALLAKHTSATGTWALAIAGLGIVALLGVLVVFFSAQLRGPLDALGAQLQSVEHVVSKYFDIGSMKDLLGGSSLGTLFVRAVSWGTAAISAAVSVLLVLVGGIYMAANPTPYREGLITLSPPEWHARIRATLDDAGAALQLWLGAQLLAMVMVGVLVGTGAWFLGIPSPIALGLVFGLLEFVPLVGPIVGAIPVILVAAGQSWELALWALGLVIAVQQVESNVIMPLVSGRAVQLPPAVALFAIVAMGLVFGPLGLVLGYPLAVVGDVAIRRLYVREILGEPVEIAAEKERQAQTRI